MTDATGSGKLTRPDGEFLAYQIDRSDKPAGPTGLVWLGGFKSDMTGTKAEALSAWAPVRGVTALYDAQQALAIRLMDK